MSAASLAFEWGFDKRKEMRSMFRVHVFQSSYDGKLVATIAEVEAVEFNGRTLYRNLQSGTVDACYHGVGEAFFDTREEAVEAAAEKARTLAAQFSADCTAVIARLREVNHVVA
jgi:hypothetical protein